MKKIALLLTAALLSLTLFGCSNDPADKLEFTLNDDGASYTLSGCEDIANAGTALTIPGEYKGLPVTYIAHEVFLNESALGSVVIEEGVTDIGSGAFRGCKNIKNLTLPASLTNIDTFAFRGCNSLTSMTVASDSTTYYVDGNCLIEKKNGILIVGFSDVAIPNGVTSIADFALENGAFTSINIPVGVESIGTGAFSNCSNLTAVTIPSTVTNIGSSVFNECTALTTITYAGTMEEWKSIQSSVGSLQQSVDGCSIVCTDGTVSYTEAN